MSFVSALERNRYRRDNKVNATDIAVTTKSNQTPLVPNLQRYFSSIRTGVSEGSGGQGGGGYRMHVSEEDTSVQKDWGARIFSGLSTPPGSVRLLPVACEYPPAAHPSTLVEHVCTSTSSATASTCVNTDLEFILFSRRTTLTETAPLACE